MAKPHPHTSAFVRHFHAAHPHLSDALAAHMADDPDGFAATVGEWADAGVDPPVDHSDEPHDISHADARRLLAVAMADAHIAGDVPDELHAAYKELAADGHLAAVLGLHPEDHIQKSWDEDKHPRDHGKFSSKPGSDGPSDDHSHLSPHPDPRTHKDWELTRRLATEDEHQEAFEGKLGAAVRRHLAGVERTVRAAGGDAVWEDNRGEVMEAAKHYLRTAADAFRARQQAESERNEVSNLRKYALEVPETGRRPNHPGEGPSLHSREVERRLWDGDDEDFDEWYEGRKQEMDDHQQDLADYHEKLEEYKDKRQEAKERANVERRQEIAAQKMKAAKAVQAAKEAYADYRLARKQYNQTLYSVALESHLVKKAWNKDLHPRGDNGRFISKGDIEAAKADPEKAKELLARTTKPAERAKLEKVLAGHTEPGQSKGDDRKQATREKKEKVQASRSRAAELAAKATRGEATSEELAELADHLPALNVKQLRQVRAALYAKLGGVTRRAEILHKIKTHAQDMAGGNTQHARLADERAQERKAARAEREAKRNRVRAKIKEYGFLRPSDSEFQAHFGSMADAVKDWGMSVGLFRKDGNGFDEVAERMAKDGHFPVRDDQKATDALWEALTQDAKSMYDDVKDDYAAAEEAYYKALEDTHGKDHGLDANATADQLFSGGDLAAARGVEESVAQAVADDPYGAGGSGADLSFDPSEFAPDLAGTGEGVSEPKAGGQTPAKAEPLLSLPDDQIAAKVLDAARDHPDRFGDSKVFIHHVYDALKKDDPTLDEGAFKKKLVELNTKRHLDLQTADLLQAFPAEHINRSAVERRAGATGDNRHFITLRDQDRGYRDDKPAAVTDSAEKVNEPAADAPEGKQEPALDRDAELARLIAEQQKDDAADGRKKKKKKDKVSEKDAKISDKKPPQPAAAKAEEKKQVPAKSEAEQEREERAKIDAANAQKKQAAKQKVDGDAPAEDDPLARPPEDDAAPSLRERMQADGTWKEPAGDTTGDPSKFDYALVDFDGDTVAERLAAVKAAPDDARAAAAKDAGMTLEQFDAEVAKRLGGEPAKAAGRPAKTAAPEPPARKKPTAKPKPEPKPTPKPVETKPAASKAVPAIDEVGRKVSLDRYLKHRMKDIGMGGEYAPEDPPVPADKYPDFKRRVDEAVKSQEAKTTGGSLMHDLYTAAGVPLGLSPAEFRGGMKQLDKEGVVRLGGWPKSPHDIERPDLMPLITGNVKPFYYAHPVRD